MSTLAAALSTVASREPWLQVRAGEPVGDGWRPTAALLDRPALEELVRTGAERLGREHAGAAPGVRHTVAAAVLLDHWAWALAVAGAGVLAATGRVLDLSPDRVHLRVDDGQVVGVAAQDFAATGGEAGLRVQLDAHLGRLHDLLTGGTAPLLRRSRRLLQGGTGDAVAVALSRQAEGLEAAERERLLALTDRLIVGAGSWGCPGWLVVDGLGPPEHRVRRRTACCLWYRLPEQLPCLTCPRLSDDERRARARAAAEPAPSAPP